MNNALNSTTVYICIQSWYGIRNTKPIVHLSMKQCKKKSEQFSYDFLVFLTAALNSWPQISSCAKSSWFKNRSGVKWGFPQIYEKVLIRSKQNIQNGVLNIDLHNIKNSMALQVPFYNLQHSVSGHTCTNSFKKAFERSDLTITLFGNRLPCSVTTKNF